MISTALLMAVLHLAPTAQVHQVPAVVTEVTAPAQSGAQASAYKGKFYRPFQEKIRKCILRRESNYHYFSTNRKSGYFGGYQMTKELMHGAAWMFMPELRKEVGKERATKIRQILQATPGHKWNRYWQDRAFYTVFNWECTGSGAKHWGGGRFAC